ncbi:MAG: hypothetical protein EPN45_17965 [Rhizobiaceae bacterium]|nr:MAG: hypothetical protein EPN45_17965 [Rhizobiaceae bacterium]
MFIRMVLSDFQVVCGRAIRFTLMREGTMVHNDDEQDDRAIFISMIVGMICVAAFVFLVLKA